MSAQDDLNAAALAYAKSQNWTPPVTPDPPPPPPAAVPLFDGRASVTKTPFPTTSGSGSGTVQTPSSPDPYPVWTGYAYMGADIALAADPTWGTVYNVAPPAGHHSPYNTNPDPGTTFAQLSTRRATGLGQTFWWSESLVVVKSDTPDWGTFISLGYQTILYDQIGFGVGNGVPGNQFSIRLNSGLVQNGKAANQLVKGLKPVTLGQRVDVVIGVKVAADATGFVEPHMRLAGGAGWEKLPGFTGVPTVEWTNTTGAPIVGATVLDKEGLYFGRWSGANPGPTGVVTLRGLQRWATLQDAIASLG